MLVILVEVFVALCDARGLPLAPCLESAEIDLPPFGVGLLGTPPLFSQFTVHGPALLSNSTSSGRYAA